MYVHTHTQNTQTLSLELLCSLVQQTSLSSQHFSLCQDQILQKKQKKKAYCTLQGWTTYIVIHGDNLQCSWPGPTSNHCRQEILECSFYNHF